ncbi:MAG: hypothetical protein WCL29_02240 [Pseudomonadota bacterium]
MNRFKMLVRWLERLVFFSLWGVYFLGIIKTAWIILPANGSAFKTALSEPELTLLIWSILSSYLFFMLGTVMALWNTYVLMKQRDWKSTLNNVLDLIACLSIVLLPILCRYHVDMIRETVNPVAWLSFTGLYLILVAVCFRHTARTHLRLRHGGLKGISCAN